MFDEKKFRAQAVLKGFTMKQIAGELGIDVATLYRKMNGESDFYRSEIQKLIVLLDIQNPSEIFFAKELT